MRGLVLHDRELRRRARAEAKRLAREARLERRRMRRERHQEGPPTPVGGSPAPEDGLLSRIMLPRPLAGIPAAGGVWCRDGG
jgi:hypothetical protein